MEGNTYTNFKIDENIIQYVNNQKTNSRLEIDNFKLNNESFSNYQIDKKIIIFNSCELKGNFEIQIEEKNTSNLFFLEIIFYNCTSNSSSFVIKSNISININITDCIFFSLFVDTEGLTDLKIDKCYLWDFALCGNIKQTKIINSIGRYFINNEYQLTDSQIEIQIPRSLETNKFLIQKELLNKIKKFKILEKIDLIIDFSIQNFETIIFEKNTVLENDYEPILLNAITNINLLESDSKILISDQKFNSLEISGSSEQAELSIQNTALQKLELSSLSVDKINLYNIKSIDQSDELELNLIDFKFKKGNFELVNFGNFKNSTIKKTIIEHLVIISSIFPPKIKFKTADEGFDESKLGYEFYRQLKTAFLRNNNTVQALEAHSKMYEYAMKSEDLDKWDRFILCMNHWSNRHGTSIGHALKTILLIGFISFLLLILSSWVDSDFCPSKWFQNNFFDKAVLIFNILNPISRTDEFEKILGIKNLTFFQYLVIYLTKIGIGWGYYQFVAAFRKFGKNG